MNELILDVLYKNQLTCPECKHVQTVEMFVSEDRHTFQCDSCDEVIQSNEDECCVYCQYGEVKCTKEKIRLN